MVAPDNRHRVRDAWMSHMAEAYKDALEGKPRCGEGGPQVWEGVPTDVGRCEHSTLPGPGEWQ